MLSFFEKHSAISWIITVLIAVFIFYMSSLSFPPSKARFDIKPLLYHITIFSILAFFLLVSLVKGKDNSLVFIFGILFAVFYATTDELHQFFVPGRSSSLYDVFLDSVGILFASVIYLIELRYK